MRNFTMPVILALSILSGNANADALGLYVGVGVWDHDAVGTFNTIGDPLINVETDLGYTGNDDTYAYIAFEHFVPLLPNVRLETAAMEHTGTANNIEFNGVVGISGDSSISLDTTDIILYWRLLDNWINFDVGLNARKLDGDFVVGSETISVSETVPMLYVALQFDLPLTGLSVGGDINVISASGVTYQDIRIRALYEMGVVGFEAGLKSTTLELEDVDTINADLEFEGAMIGLFLHF